MTPGSRSIGQTRVGVMIALVAAVSMAAVGGVALQPARSATVVQILPDLRMAQPRNLWIATSSSPSAMPSEEPGLPASAGLVR
jgi:hypothetical protein